ncbi:MAG: hypothetical protein DVB28_001215 [Verrucomicrobia bacterium]|nr:MAG: hypothetical protein DVB28_001215 [Verrucomicrobiota bacterium]
MKVTQFYLQRGIFRGLAFSKFSSFLGAFFGFALGASARAEAGVKVPLSVWDFQVTSSTEAVLKESGSSVGRQSIWTQQATFLQRFPVGLKGCFLGAGVQGESFSFGGKNSAAVGELRDFAGLVSLEYFVEGLQAASLSLKPGFYFSEHVHSDCFDIPVQLVSGIPLTDHLNGVVGGAGARFYRHPIPIVGVSWAISPRLRLDAVFPEPALVYTPAKGVECKLGGELQSGGFRTNTGAPVEYYSYQWKGRVSYAMGHAVTISGAVGYEFERRVDYFRGGPSFRSEGAVLLQLGAGIAF